MSSAQTVVCFVIHLENLLIFAYVANRNGEIAQLETLEAPNEADDEVEDSKISEVENADSRKRKYSGDEIESEFAQTEEIWNVAIRELSALVGEDSAKNAVELVRFWENKSEIKEGEKAEFSKFTELPEVEEKEKRKEIHQWIRNKFSEYAVGDTHDGRIRIW